MRICLLGYGRMGHEVEQVALSRGHKIAATVDSDWDTLPSCDIVIEFSRPEAAFNNITKCIQQGLPIVSGTTGWLEQWGKAVDCVKQNNGTLFYASNFSVGVYLFRLINTYMARLMNHYPNYLPTVEETHHIHKLDYPSGTALTIANEMLEYLDSKSETLAYLEPNKVPTHRDDQLLITSIRRDSVPGTHVVKYESEEDVLTLSHEAKGRKGLALGAVLAAEFVVDKKGIYGMEDLIQLD